ncbi:MAG: peptide chain release factor N(5)-glutamine methyltransferase [Acidobacteria bacterium]|nr:MAG: peptide chain release factor N(5)-glutamine methyltransferase [Acidobacteriota bacterium]
MTYADVVARAAAALVASGLDRADAEADAAVLARHLLNWDFGHWLLHERDTAGASFTSALDAAIQRRATREPVAYIIGEREFYGRPFIVSPAVLIPRPETELIIETSLGTVAPGHPYSGTICDLGTGSGCLAVTLALELPDFRIVATDISAAALDVARRNALALGAGERIAFHEGTFFAGSTERFDLIVSNPPYVAASDRATLQRDVVDFEPATALFSGDDGLDCIRELVRLAPDHLKPGGALIFEFGFGQADAIPAILAASRLTLADIKPDLQAIPRVAIAAL